MRGATITEIAARVGRTPARVVLRWHLQNGFVAIPKAADTRHLADNFGAWEFALSDGDMARIDALDASVSSFGADPLLHQSERGRID